MSPRFVGAMWLAVALGAVLLAVPGVRDGLRTQSAAIRHLNARSVPTTTQTPPKPELALPPGGAAAVTRPPGVKWVGWELIDRDTGHVIGGSADATTHTNRSESMIKAWIAADYLRRNNPSSSTLASLREMIIDSRDDLASHYYAANGGDASITGSSGLDRVCGLGRTPVAIAGQWSYTTMTPDQAARMGECIANGTAAGSHTNDLLTWMRQVRGGVGDQPSVPYGTAPYPNGNYGGGHWGIIDALPASLAAQTSIKNGWEPETSDNRFGNAQWNINCLAILPHQVLAVMVKYPWRSPTGKYQNAYNLQPGADACASIARQLLSFTAG